MQRAVLLMHFTAGKARLIVCVVIADHDHAPCVCMSIQAAVGQYYTAKSKTPLR